MLLRNFTGAGPYTFLATAIAGNLALGTNTLTAVATDKAKLKADKAQLKADKARLKADRKLLSRAPLTR